MHQSWEVGNAGLRHRSNIRSTQEGASAARQAAGVREVADHIWLISFMHYDLGFFDA